MPAVSYVPAGVYVPRVAGILSSREPQVSVSVYDDAGVSATVLAAAEQRTARIFDEAGVDVVWKNCSTSRTHVGPDALVRAGEQSSPGILVGADQKNLARRPAKTAELRPAGRVGAPAPTRSDLDCASFAWPTRLAVRIAPRSASSAGEVFGVAFLSDEGTGCYSDVFYERALELHADWNVGLSDILGNVMAHELGHLFWDRTPTPARESCEPIGKAKSCTACREVTCGSPASKPTTCAGN